MLAHFIRTEIRQTRFDVIPYVIDRRLARLTCEEKRRLFAEYQEAAANYTQLVRQLAHVAGAVNTQFEFVNRRVQTARKLSIDARDRLRKHTVEHKC